MMIACPRCGASYEVEPLLFGVQPRTVQCSACDFRWTQRPEAEPIAASGRPSGDDDGRDARSDSVDPPPEAEDGAESGGPADDGGPDAEVALVERAPPAGDPPPLGVEPPEEEFPPDELPAETDATRPVDREVEPPFDDEPPEPGGQPLREAPSAARPAAPLQVKRRFALPNSRRFVAGSAAAATVIALTSVLLLLRDPIVELVPAIRGFYAMLGVMPDPLGAGLEIREISSLREREGGEDILTVTGVVANVAQAPAPLPVVRVSLYDANDEELQFVDVRNDRASLDAGETLHFDARITGPRPEARSVRVGFSPKPGS